MPELTTAEKIVALRRSGLTPAAVAVILGTDIQTVHEVQHDPASAPVLGGGGGGLSAGAVESIVDDKLAALPSGGGSVPATLMDEVGDHATRISAIEAALNITAPGHDPVPLVFSAAGDTNGLFYWLGTNGGNSPWQNPVKTTPPRVGITATAPVNSDPIYAPEVVVARDDNFYQSADQAGAFIAFDLKGRRMDVDRYAIRNRTGQPYYIPVNWKVQGSLDGEAWTDLDTVVNDWSLSGWGGLGQWYTRPVSDGTAWSHLRFLQTGLDIDSANYLVLGEIEFYGTLIP